MSSLTPAGSSGIQIVAPNPTGEGGAALNSNFTITDAHITSTLNPHQTTAAQIGAYTSSQTDTLLAGKAASTLVSAQSTSIGNLSTTISSQATSITNLNTTVSAQATSLTNLATTVSAEATSLTNLTTTVSSQATAIAGKADTTLVTNHTALTTTAHGGIVPASRTISTTAPLTGSGTLSSNITLAMPQATTSVDGYLSHTDFTTFNNKGSGSVTSVSLASSGIIVVSGSPITSSGTITLATNTASPNQVLAGPATGTVSATATVRSLVAADIPSLPGSLIGSGTVADARLSSNVPLKNAGNTFTGFNVFSNSLTSFGGYINAVGFTSHPTNEGPVFFGSGNTGSFAYVNAVLNGSGNTINGGSYVFDNAIITGQGNVIGGGYSENSFIGGGYGNYINGAYGGTSDCFIGNGSGNTVHGQYSSIVGGTGNNASGSRVFVGGGAGNTCTGPYSSIAGGISGYATHYGERAYSAGEFGNLGDAQNIELLARFITLNATPALLWLDGDHDGSNRLSMPDKSVWTFQIKIVAVRTDTGTEGAGYSLFGAIRRDSGASSTALIGSVTKIANESTSAWDANATADTSNGALSITVTGEAAKTIYWVAHISIVQVIRP